VVRADSAFYAKTVITTCHRRKVRFSVTTRIDAKIRTACDSITDDQWIHIKYPQAIFDEDTGRWISDAQIAETVYTAFAGTRHAVTARLIVRRIRRDDPTQIPRQQELLPTYRYHAVFTDSPFTLVQAEAQHRAHAIIEQINADLIAGPLAHLPSGRFSANDAWLTCAAIAHNLTRTAGHLAAGAYRTARPATIRTRIINVAARLAHHARTIHLHLPSTGPGPPRSTTCSPPPRPTPPEQAIPAKFRRPRPQAQTHSAPNNRTRRKPITRSATPARPTKSPRSKRSTRTRHQPRRWIEAECLSEWIAPQLRSVDRYCRGMSRQPSTDHAIRADSSYFR
jgi:hypothetical protein